MGWILGALGSLALLVAFSVRQRIARRLTTQTTGYLENDRLVILDSGRRVRVEAVDWPSLATRPTSADPVAIEEAIGVYQGASLAFKTGLLHKLN
ncbi:MAG: hypothetical protein P9E24_07410 [Candidatus Competibacter sp.]|nr:hypothetical protein [Candidatus Competibacter sp.]MDG4584756.1 hypothetical protein [Candidatus Competibacter sp.]